MFVDNIFLATYCTSGILAKLAPSLDGSNSFKGIIVDNIFFSRLV